MFHTGIGAHQWNVRVTVFLNNNNIKVPDSRIASIEELTNNKMLKAVNFLYGPMMISTKLSILLLYFRLFNPNKSVKSWIYVGTVTTLLNHVVGTILAITLCLPSDAMGFAKCSNKLNVLDIVISVINIVSDFYILILPLFVISRLQMKRQRKLGIGAVFATGLWLEPSPALLLDLKMGKADLCIQCMHFQCHRTCHPSHHMA